jgi:trans-2,3-dihydro-3-hydroxyanthranilate isomerase
VRYAFRLVDVFTEKPLTGNQLAVVLDAEGIDEQRMQAIAREFNFSETTFVTASETAGCDWRVRIFTPSVEMPFAGHPTVGTAVVLESLDRISGTTVFGLGVGPTPVRVRPGWAEMDQRPPVFGPEHPDVATLAAVLGAEPEDIAGSGLAPEVVSTGLPYLVVPVRSLGAVRRLRPRLDLWETARAGFERVGVYAFARESVHRGADAHCRMFAADRAAEDAATGSAAGPLACFLALRADGAQEGTRRYRLEQGFELGRESLLEASVDLSGGTVTAVRVGGGARIVAEGWLDVPD